MLTAAQQIRNDIENARTTFNNLMAQANEFLDEYAGIINIWASPRTIVMGEYYVSIMWRMNHNDIEVIIGGDEIVLYINVDQSARLPFDKDIFVTNMHKMFGGSTA